MNIEEERKAFDNVFAERFPALERGAEIERSLADLGAKQTAFEGWCLAKAHAEEMDKPTIKIIYKELSNKWCIFERTQISGLFLSTGDSFETECEALEWAKSKGYRVIEE